MYSERNEARMREGSPSRAVVCSALGLCWTIVRLPVLAFLVVLEPIICGLLWLLATLGILTALFYEFVVRDPRFPFWLCLGLSIGLALLTGVYYALIRFFGGGRD
ncbi:MAG: hypothetical protein IT480_18900 [Gammaproteobacteria bacterium]|nr:hypothetical protein [Gammaproteobacteria bacterium]